ncbi:MAG: uracil-DNA glycosylase [Clostridiales bacterium]|mgnify:CR=1 FL=1|nr:uracil-DNA glycosylase [Clostridiales bacterium]OPZ67678.1 MAG: Uracil DNA glycosylase superfamily protein [Firmicutes bacterium ADurb.Bin467]
MPECASGYLQCELCTPRSPVVWGEGNPRAPVAVILDNPGAREDREGREYVCGTRQTLQLALHGAGLSPDDVYLTYLLKCRPLRAYDRDAVRAFSLPFLVRQIEAMRPELVACLGDIVARALFGEGAQVKALRGAWQTALGRPCMVSYHPLAVRRRPNLMRLFAEDWAMLAARLGDFRASPPEPP